MQKENNNIETEIPEKLSSKAALEIEKAQRDEIESLGYSTEDELYEAARFVKYLGDKSNILKIEYAEPRIKATLSDISLIDEISLKKAGAKGVLKSRSNNTADIIVGYDLQILYENINKVLGKI